MTPMPVTLPIARFWGSVDARFDRIAIGVSGLCLVHCLTTTILLTVVSSAGGLLSPVIHEVGLTLAIGFGVIALGRGIFAHGYMMPAVVGAFGLGIMAGALSLPHGEFEIFWTLVGVSLVALGHDLNRRATY
ncbi:MAG: MerC domain-containing protein [Sphingomonadales bacterium]|nr:MAG: MerC domain-containing protein [Sphingomonadales bacterium]